MPHAKQRIRDTADMLSDANRASARRRAKSRELEQKKYSDAFRESQRRYQHDRDTLLAEHTWACSYCGTIRPPTVIPLEHREGVAIVRRERCGCSGEVEALTLEREAQKKNKTPFEAHQWVAYMRRAGLVQWLARATFDTYEPENHSQKRQKALAVRYCAALLQDKLGYKPWLVFYGPYGTGKTHLAAAIIHEAMSNGWARCRFRVWPEWLETLQATFDGVGKSSVVVDELKAGKLLVIDDIDKQHPTKSGWAEEKLFTALNHRYNEGLPTILTFNHPPGEMTPWLGEAIVDRIIQMSFECLEFNGKSYRSDIDWTETRRV